MVPRLVARRFVSRLALIVALAALAPIVAAADAPADSSGDASNAAADSTPTAGVEFFESKIRPVLVERCYKCHSADAKAIKGGLRLDSRDAIRRGGDSGKAVVPGDPAASLLLDAVRYESFEMPPDGKLAPQIVADLEKWIRDGAIDPRTSAPRAPEPSVDVKSDVADAGDGIDWDAARKHWAFQPAVEHDLPAIANSAGFAAASRRLDGFIRARLAEENLLPAVAADRRTLIRRVSFDAIGLPPTPDEVEAFLADESPDAEERLVDRLLASPRYGERWSRLWLDLARYGEDQAHIVGDDRSLCYPNAYLYRNWVIAALNADMPYDRFVTLQLAADQATPEDESDDVALGFLGLGPKYYDRGSLEVMAEEWDDRVDTVMRTLVGLTVACARCHDHKFDPIETEDYYALAGVFASTQMFNRPLDDKAEKNKNGQAKKAEQAMHIVRDENLHDLNVFIRGDVKSKGPIVKRRFLHVLSPGEPRPFEHGSGRLDLARSIVDPANPLTTRVIVNRVWASSFGQPLVATPSNFGIRGEQPTHRELLDDLSSRFVAGGWSLKSLHRELFTSATYQQASHASEAALARDPANVTLSRMNRRRLSIEAWRDALLAAAGVLENRIGGPSIEPDKPDERRRTIYAGASRLELNKMLALFDYPDPNVHSEHRTTTTTPLQKLFVMNGPLMVATGDRLAQRLIAELPADKNGADGATTTTAHRIDLAYQLLYGRAASDAERSLGGQFIASLGEDEAQAWSQYAQVLLASNEMLFVD
ncbi:MAG: PSD1 and planctomycete cytochrome C domain-containing protein [Pirellulales bacterium]